MTTVLFTIYSSMYNLCTRNSSTEIVIDPRSFIKYTSDVKICFVSKIRLGTTLFRGNSCKLTSPRLNLFIHSRIGKKSSSPIAIIVFLQKD